MFCFCHWKNPLEIVSGHYGEPAFSNADQFDPFFALSHGWILKNDEWYLFFFIAAAITACMSNPCLNGATCADNGAYDNYTCACPDGFHGERCQGKQLSTAQAPSYEQLKDSCWQIWFGVCGRHKKRAYLLKDCFTMFKRCKNTFNSRRIGREESYNTSLLRRGSF